MRSGFLKQSILLLSPCRFSAQPIPQLRPCGERRPSELQSCEWVQRAKVFFFSCKPTFHGVLIRRDREDRCCFGCKRAFPRSRLAVRGVGTRRSVEGAGGSLSLTHALLEGCLCVPQKKKLNNHETPCLCRSDGCRHAWKRVK